MIRVRFAPSPTGYLHVGGLRQALYNYLLVKKLGGSFILRIEDTDRKRFVPGSIESLIQALDWAGLSYDEGPVLQKGKIVQKGKFGPYIQSERLPIYQKYAQELIDKGQAYYCFCDEQRLEKLRREQALNKQPTRYDGCCRNLTAPEIKKLLENKVPYVIRFKNPLTGQTKVNDLIRGEVVWQNENLDDQILLKNDGYPTYHLASVVDDHLMEVTHILRGEEWLPSTPKHLLTYQAFGWTPPQFAHLSLVLNPDRSKLSKRQGDVAVEDYQKKGYLPEALLNFIALLGWNPGNDQELLSMAEMAKLFDWQQINKSGAIFDLAKLNWFNSEYIKKLSPTEFIKKITPFIQEAVGQDELDKKLVARVAEVMQNRLNVLSEIKDYIYLFTPLDYPTELLRWKKSDLAGAQKALRLVKACLAELSTEEWQLKILEEKLTALVKENNLTTGEVLWPLRAALSGQQYSPSPFELAYLLGQAETLERLEQALYKLK